MDRACRLRSCALVRRVRQGGEEVLAHVGCLHTRRSLRAFEVCSGFHGWTCPEFYRRTLFWDFIDFTSMTVLFSQHACVTVLTRLSESSRRGGEEV